HAKAAGAGRGTGGAWPSAHLRSAMIRWPQGVTRHARWESLRLLCGRPGCLLLRRRPGRRRAADADRAAPAAARARAAQAARRELELQGHSPRGRHGPRVARAVLPVDDEDEEEPG